MKKENARQESILGDMKPSRAITRLAVPATLALLAKAVYNIVDTAYIGMLGSDIALAAVGVTLPLLLIMVSVENIFAAGAAVDGHIRGWVICIHWNVSMCGRYHFHGAFTAGLRSLRSCAAPGRGLRILDVCGGPCQSSRPEYELRGQGRVICKDLIYRGCDGCCS